MTHYARCIVLQILCVVFSCSTGVAQEEHRNMPSSVPFTPDSAYEVDRKNLDALQHDAFLYMWEHSHPDSGMVYEATFNWDVVPVATGATGFGVAALICAVERGWVTRDAALYRLLKIARFLQHKTARKNLYGAFPHWLNGSTGETIPFGEADTGADIVETALLMQGLLLVRQYFNGPGAEAELRAIITEIWHDIDWQWFTTGAGGRNNPEDNGLYWHWSPKTGFNQSFKILGYNECLIAYILALASPTHPISRTSYDYWTSGRGYQNKVIYGYDIEASLVGGGPLFLAQYSFMGLDPRRMADAFVKEGYFVRNIKQTLSNRGYSLLTAPAANAYSDRYWGLTASRVKSGYAANEPKKDRATVAPTAALTSLPYTPQYSLQVLAALRQEFQEKMWGPWGPYDAFSLRHKWYSSDYLAINQLPMVIMAENYRTGLLWRLFMQDDDVRAGLKKAGITDPQHKTGFPEVVRPLLWESSGYYEDAYVVRRHPDTGLYHVPYWLEKAGHTIFRIYQQHNTLLWEQKLSTAKGRNTFKFPQFAPKSAETYHLHMLTEAGEEYILPLRLQ